MKVFLCLIAVLACGLGPASAQVSLDTDSEPPDVLRLPWLCLSAHMEEFQVSGPNCPQPGTFYKRWGITCNPLCYPSYSKVGMTTRGACLRILNVLPQWLHCAGTPPQQLAYFGDQFRARGSNGYIRAFGLWCQQFASYLYYSCNGCDDIWACLEDPVIVSLEDGYYELTDTKGGVEFDLNGDGETEKIPWTGGKDDAFLVLDRNGNGLIDDGRELFSHVSPQQPSLTPNGFQALRMFDDPLNGGNDDGRLNASDEIYGSLSLWLDADRDGSTDTGELVSLSSVGLAEIELDYTDEFAHDDEHGNTFKYSAPAHFDDGRSVLAWAVFFNIEECLRKIDAGPGRQRAAQLHT